MTKEALRQLRESRGMTRDQLAAELGCSAGAIVQWEGGTRSIPHWVEEKLLRTVEITLPLAELGQLLNLAVARQEPFEKVLVQALRDWLTKHRPKD